MDISKLNARAASDRGSDMHLRDPFGKPGRGETHKTGGALLYRDKDKPVLFHVLGNEASVVQAERRAMEEEQSNGARIPAKEAVFRVARVALTGWQNLMDGGSEYPFNDANRDAVLRNSDNIQIQIIDHMGDVGNVRPGDETD